MKKQKPILSMKERETLWLFGQKGLLDSEIAELKGVSMGTISKRWVRMYEKLKVVSKMQAWLKAANELNLFPELHQHANSTGRVPRTNETEDLAD